MLSTMGFSQSTKELNSLPDTPGLKACATTLAVKGLGPKPKVWNPMLLSYLSKAQGQLLLPENTCPGPRITGGTSCLPTISVWVDKQDHSQLACNTYVMYVADISN
jgi:hypothetical protein